MRGMRPIFLLFIFCSSVIGQEVRKALPVEGRNSPWNARAQFLAGVPLTPDQPLEKLQRRAGYQAHAAEFEKMWARYNEHYFSPMRTWSAMELAPRISRTAPVYYFFGGPDAISALAFFPDASDYILGGLEPIGQAPDPTTLAPAALDAALQSLRQSTQTILSFGHFITKDMKAEFAIGEFRGVTPILLSFLAMSGSEILDVSFFGVNGEGHSVEYGSHPREKPGELPGVTITFRKNPLTPAQKLHYIRANVADDALRSEGSILRWAEQFAAGNVYFKAASYLLHESSFSRIRGFLLGRAQSVLQDDSGMPFSFFQNGEWRLWFFGRYSGTLEIFKQYDQPILREAFQTSGAPLPFGTGYKWRLGESNLLLAVKQAPPRAEAVTPVSSD